MLQNARLLIDGDHRPSHNIRRFHCCLLLRMIAIFISLCDCLSTDHVIHDAKTVRYSPRVNPPNGYGLFLTRRGTPCGNYG
jgi:hypothetical protein